MNAITGIICQKKEAMALSLIIFFCVISFSGCRISDTGTVVKDVKLTPNWPRWKYLPEFCSSVILPALYTESSNRFHHCCVTNTDNIDTANPELYVDDKCMDMIYVLKNVKATLCSLMINALPVDERENPDDICRIVSTWHGIIYGISYIYVNPESILFEFEKDHCAIPDSEWYKQGKEIAAGAVVIDSIVLISEDKLPEKSVDVVETCLQKGDLTSGTGLVFTMLKSEKGYYKVRVRSIIYAIRIISPYIRKVHLSFDSLYLGKIYVFNRCKFSIDDDKTNPTIYSFTLDPPQGRKRKYCGVIGASRSFAVTSKCIGTILPRRTDFGYQADITVSIVGITQNEIQDIF